ncbi:MAG TPA: glycine oxidase ThiO [Polyangia bacterium]
MSDVLVVGGGMIGCAIALRLADAGVAVTVVERGEPGREASWAAGGILAPEVEAHGPGAFFTLMRAGAARWRSFAEELRARAELDVGYRDDGTLQLAFDDDEAAPLEARARWQRGEGLAVETLDAAAVARLEPSLARPTLALRYAGGHQIDTRAAMRALVVACTRAPGNGVRFVRADVRRVRHDGKRVLGVDTNDGSHDAGHVVIAAGAWSTAIEGVPLPPGAVTPVRGQMIELRAAAPLVQHVVFGAGGYLVPRADGRVLVGSTEERAGFAKDVTAAGLGTLCARAARLCPPLASLPVADHWSGLRPASADALPYLGATSIGNLWMASGHFRNGVLLAPLSGEIVAALVTGAAVPVDLTAVAPSRA